MRVYLNLILLMLLVTISASSYAQSNKEVDVTLRSGTIYHGVIYEEMKDSIRLLTEEDHILQIARSEIVSIEKKPNRRSEWIKVQDSKRKHYFTTNFTSQITWLDELAFGVEAIGGIKHHKNWQHGLGMSLTRETGFADYESFYGQVIFQNRFNINSHGSTPFISYEPRLVLSIYTRPANDVNRYKVLSHSLEFGYRFYSAKKNSSFNLSIAAQQFGGRYVYSYYNWYTDQFGTDIGEWHNTFNATLKLGFQI